MAFFKDFIPLYAIVLRIKVAEKLRRVRLFLFGYYFAGLCLSLFLLNCRFFCATCYGAVGEKRRAKHIFPLYVRLKNFEAPSSEGGRLNNENKKNSILSFFCSSMLHAHTPAAAHGIVA